MAQYKGAASEGTRAVNLLKRREKEREELEKIKQKISEDIGVKPNFQSTQNKFSTHYDVVEEELKSTTVGLMTLEQMMERRELLVKEREKKLAAALATDEDKDSLDGRNTTKRKKEESKKMLSFNMDDDEEEDEDEGSNGVSDRTKTPSDSPPPVKKPKFGRFGKNPNVDTSFLPDRDREDEERMERDRLRQKWVEQQEKLKNEDIEIVYSYWDGSGHRRRVMMKKGNTIQQFLQKCLENLRKEFTELRVCSVDGLMYIKEDLIIPQHHSFYDFILNKARGKSGPLFNFDVHDDVRLISDAGVEKDESHAGKVVLRSWYERNKHIFPASRWEPYDPEKKWDKYTISDKTDV